MSAAVSLKDVTFSYPETTSPALVRASLEVAEGSFVLVTGDTGSGKSTLIRAMNGLVPHFSGGSFAGRVEVAGRDTRAHPPRALSDVVGFVPQDPGAAFVVDLVEDELAYGMENLAMDPSVMRRRVEEVLDLLGLEALRDRSVRTLSGGERQRVSIGAALAPGPRILLLDEPTSQLDPQGAEDVLAALQRLVHDLGLTVILAEHRLERVAGFVDSAIGCRAGMPPVTGEPQEVLEIVGSGPPVTRLGRMISWEPPPLTVRDARRRAATLDLPAPSEARPSADGDGIVAARSVRASYGGAPALDRVSLALRPGEVVAVLGRNGAGKTTLLRCLAGLHIPDEGDVIGPFRSPHPPHGPRPPRPGRDVALCPQRPESVVFRDRVDDEVVTTLRSVGAALDPRALLDELGIAELAASHPRDLSAGERLLVAVAAIVATGAPVLLLDEPTRGLDPGCKDRLALFLARRAARGDAIAVATHDVELVAEIASRAVVLASGQVIADGSPSEVLADSPVFAPQMTRVFGRGWLTPAQVAKAVTS